VGTQPGGRWGDTAIPLRWATAPAGARGHPGRDTGLGLNRSPPSLPWRASGGAGEPPSRGRCHPRRGQPMGATPHPPQGTHTGRGDTSPRPGLSAQQRGGTSPLPSVSSPCPFRGHPLPLSPPALRAGPEAEHGTVPPFGLAGGVAWGDRSPLLQDPVLLPPAPRSHHVPCPQGAGSNAAATSAPCLGSLKIKK